MSVPAVHHGCGNDVFVLDSRGKRTTRLRCEELVCCCEFQQPVLYECRYCRPGRCSVYLLPLEGDFQARDMHCGTNGDGFNDFGDWTMRSTSNCCFFRLPELLQEDCYVCCKLRILILVCIQFAFESPESKSSSNTIAFFQIFFLFCILKLQRSPCEGFLNLPTLTICAREP